MPVPEEPLLLPDLLASAATELKDLPHIKELNEPLAIAFRDLHSLLYNKTERYRNTEACKDVFRKLPNALRKALSLAAKWKRSKLRVLLYWSTFADDLSAALMKIRNLFDSLQVKPTKRDIAKEIVKKLDRVVQGLRDRGRGSELYLAATNFKKELLAFLRANQTSGATVSISTWIAKHLGSEVDSIRQELQEIKDNTDSTSFHGDEDLDAVLLEQLLLSLALIEEKTAGETFILEEVKAKLKCSLCDGLMINPVTVESGWSFCKHCMEERFRRGYSTCPGSKTEISRNFVINVALQSVIFSFGEAEEPPASEASTEEGESSDANNRENAPFDENSERRVQVALEYLTSPAQPKVLTGFAHLIKCASLPGGPLAVFNATFIQPLSDHPPVKAIPTVLGLAKTQDPQYSKLAMKLMVALTEERESDSEIMLEVADGLDVLISLMKEGRVTRTRLLAAETVKNILVNRQVRKTVRSYDGIVPALYALWNVDPAGVSPRDLKKADTVCRLGLQRLAKCSKRGDKTQMIVAALLKLLRRGLSYQPELTSLVKDSLVALENIVMKMKPTKDNTTNEVLNAILKDMKDLLAKREFEAHSTVPGRMAIISIMTKLCGSYEEEIIDKYLFLLLLKMMERTRTEIDSQLLALSPPPQIANVENLKTLLGRSVRLLHYCVTHGKATAQSVLRENVQERNILEEMVRSEHSGILDGARLEIQSILDQIDVETTPETVVGNIEILSKLSKSKDQRCRQQVASKFRTFVAANQNLSEFKAAGGIDALMTLLRDPNPSCQRDALIALQELSLADYEIPVDHLPFRIILDFLDERRPTDEKEAAIGLLGLIVKVPDGPAMFVQTRGALKTTLNFLKKASAESSRGCHKCAFALLEMARANESVRHRIAEPDLRGLDIVVEYAKDHGSFELKELLTDTLVLFCESGDACQDAVIRADAHIFLLTSLREKISKGKAAQGLLELIQVAGFREKVLEAGYVRIALESIDARFVRSDIALGLAELSSFPEALDQIYARSDLSVPALLNLLERCREPEGKNAAAQVISRLYPRLNKRPEELERRKNIADRCELLFNKLDPSDVSHVKAFLEALAAIAADADGKFVLHECRGDEFIINNLSVSQTTEVQGLMLKILAVMSSDTDDNNMAPRITKARNGLLETHIDDKLFALFKSNDFKNRTENVNSGLIIIRNLSLLGSSVCEKLAEQGAVDILLDVLKRYLGSLTVTTELTVKALEKFMDNLSGKQIFLRAEGVQSLAAVLKLDTYGRTGEAKSCAAIILTAVAKDEQTCKDACNTIFGCDILSALNEIIVRGETSRIKWQAAVLMKLLAMYGPTKNVCIAMNARGCLEPLISLRTIQHCDEMANDVLKFVSEKNKDCKKFIDNYSTSNRGR